MGVSLPRGDPRRIRGYREPPQRPGRAGWSSWRVRRSSWRQRSLPRCALTGERGTLSPPTPCGRTAALPTSRSACGAGTSGLRPRRQNWSASRPRAPGSTRHSGAHRNARDLAAARRIATTPLLQLPQRAAGAELAQLPRAPPGAARPQPSRHRRGDLRPGARHHRRQRAQRVRRERAARPTNRGPARPPALSKAPAPSGPNPVPCRGDRARHHPEGALPGGTCGEGNPGTPTAQFPRFPSPRLSLPGPPRPNPLHPWPGARQASPAPVGLGERCGRGPWGSPPSSGRSGVRGGRRVRGETGAAARPPSSCLPPHRGDGLRMA